MIEFKKPAPSTCSALPDRRGRLLVESVFTMVLALFLGLHVLQDILQQE